MKKMIFGEEAREKLLEGAELMYKAVASTYSPKGRNVTIARQWGSPITVSDGVTVAKEVESKDEFVQMGIELIREAATNQVSKAGDGTTLTTILSYWLTKKGMKMVKEKIDPRVIRKQMEEALPQLVEEIRKISKPIKNKEEIRHVAYISSNDDQIADAVAEAVQKVGSDGLVTVEQSAGDQIKVDYSEGLEIERGWGNYPHFVTNPDRMEAVIEDVSVLVLGRKVTTQQEMQLLLEAVVASGSKNVLFIGDVSGDALTMVIFNKMKGNISALIVSPPNYGDTRREILDDIALLTGSTVVIDEIGMKPDQFIRSFNAQWIGTTKMVIARKTTTNIIKYEPSDFAGNEDAAKQIKARNDKILDRIATIREQAKKVDSIYEKEKIKERLARLTTGVAVIKVGQTTEATTREKLERVKDAVPATQASAEQGIVPGGGVVLTKIGSIFDKKAGTLNDGEKLLLSVLTEPIKKMLENAGETERIDAILKEMKEKGGSFGYNCETGKVEDLTKSGVLDPTKVIVNALENAVAVASSVLTNDCLIAIEREEVKNSNMQMA